VISRIGSGVITLAAATSLGHPIGDLVVRAGGSVQYVDAELAQDVCAAGRVQRLGISSEPSLTTKISRGSMPAARAERTVAAMTTSSSSAGRISANLRWAGASEMAAIVCSMGLI